MSRLARGFLACALLLPGCALHLRAPTPDFEDRTPVAPAAEVSHLAAVAHLPLDLLAAMVEQQTVAPIQRGDRLGFATWSIELARQGRVVARGQDGSLCFSVPFQGMGRITAMGQTLSRVLAARVELCAQPRLENGTRPDEGATLRLLDPVARIQLDRQEIGGPGRALLDIAAEQLEHHAGRDLAAYARTLRLPTVNALAPLLKALVQPMPLGSATQPDAQGCLKLRPQALRLAQPEVDANALRLAVSVTALPTVEQPCRPSPTAVALPRAEVQEPLQHPKTRMLLAVGVSLATVQAELLAALRKLGRISLKDQGHVEITGLRLDSANGALLVRAKVVGVIRDSFLGIAISRPLDGELLLWGIPTLDRDAIHLADVHLDLQTDDGVVGLGAALKRARLTEIVQETLRLPRARIEGEAKAALKQLEKGIRLGDQTVPVRIDQELLTLEHVAARGQRLDVLVRFVGQIVVGAR